MTNLITWPFTGKLPPQLSSLRPAVPKRGPVPPSPSLTAEERERFFDHLLATAMHAAKQGESLLKRQAVYLLGFDARDHVVSWLRGEHENCAEGVGDTEPSLSSLLESRSAALALASVGEEDYVHAFVAKLGTRRAEVVNLNYWAYWIGELAADQSDDSFMLDADRNSWTGSRLFDHLASRLSVESSHRSLNLYSLHSLVASRSSVLADGPGLRSRFTDMLESLASGDSLTRLERDQVAGLYYALRIANR